MRTEISYGFHKGKYEKKNLYSLPHHPEFNDSDKEAF